MYRSFSTICAAAVAPLVLFFGWGQAAVAQQVVPPAAAQTYDRPPYERLEASAEAYDYYEAERRRQIDRQLQLIEQMKWYSGLPPAEGETVYYRYPLSVRRYPPSREYIYATGRLGILAPYPRRASPGDGDIFEPWPYVPGDIWGYSYYDPVRQPIGQLRIQTGPNRWESHPIYAPPEAPLDSSSPPPAPADDEFHDGPEPRRPLRGPTEF